MFVWSDQNWFSYKGWVSVVSAVGTKKWRMGCSYCPHPKNHLRLLRRSKMVHSFETCHLFMFFILQKQSQWLYLCSRNKWWHWETWRTVQLSSINIDQLTDVVTDDSAVSKTDHRASVAYRDQYAKSAAQGHFACCSGHSRCTTGRTTATCSLLSHTCLSVTKIVSLGWWLLADVLPAKRPYQWKIRELVRRRGRYRDRHIRHKEEIGQ